MPRCWEVSEGRAGFRNCAVSQNYSLSVVTQMQSLISKRVQFPMNGLLKNHVGGESIWEQHRLQIHTQSEGCHFTQFLMECPLHLQSVCTSANLP